DSGKCSQNSFNVFIAITLIANILKCYRFGYIRVCFYFFHLLDSDYCLTAATIKTYLIILRTLLISHLGSFVIPNCFLNEIISSCISKTLGTIGLSEYSEL